MSDNTWVLVRYNSWPGGPNPTGRLGFVQAISRRKWDEVSNKFTQRDWGVIAEGTEEEMMALEKINRS